MNNIILFKTLTIAKRLINCLSVEIKRVDRAAAFHTACLTPVATKGSRACVLFVLETKKAWFSLMRRHGLSCRDGSKISF